MPTEYLAPGVYVEEISSGPRPIEGVPTSTAGFVGAARYGPVRLAPAALSSLAEFERSYLPFGAAGGALQFEGGADSSDFLWHAVRAFFAEGGRRLYVSRVFKPRAGGDAPDDRLHCDGHARVDASRTGGVQIRARYPGAAGNLRVGLVLRGGAEALVADADPATGVPRTTLRSVTDLDLVWLHRRDAPDPAAGALHLARRDAKQASWRLEPGNGGDHVDVANLTVGAEPGAGDSVRRVALQVSLHSGDGLQDLAAWVDLPIDPRHAADSVFARFAEAPAKAADARNLPLVFACTAELRTAFDVLAALGLGEWRPAGDAGDPPSADDPPGLQLALEGGNDGMRPDAAAFEGGVDPKTGAAHGLAQLEAIDEIALVAAPGSSCRYGAGWRENADAIADLLVAHATRLRYRFALLDSAEGQTIAEVRARRARFDTSHAALYYPWIMVPDPAHGRAAAVAAERLRRRHLRAQRRRARRAQGAGERGGALGHRAGDIDRQERAGGAEPRGHQLLSRLRGPGHTPLGRPHGELRPGLEIRQPAPLLRLRRALDRQGNAVGGVRAERRNPVGERAARDRELPACRMARRRARRRQRQGGVLRRMRSHDHDAGRPRQRPADLPRWHGAAAAGRVRDLPYWPMDGRAEGLTRATHRRHARTT